jgi:hypothetical protein
VAVLRERGHDVAVLARSTGVDVTTGQGLDAALEGVAAVLDLTSTATTRRRTATEFFTAGTSHLLTAEEQAGVGHHVVLSIVGVDEVDTGYYLGKRRQEELGAPHALAGATLTVSGLAPSGNDWPNSAPRTGSPGPTPISGTSRPGHRRFPGRR